MKLNKVCTPLYSNATCHVDTVIALSTLLLQNKSLSSDAMSKELAAFTVMSGSRCSLSKRLFAKRHIQPIKRLINWDGTQSLQVVVALGFALGIEQCKSATHL